MSMRLKLLSAGFCGAMLAMTAMAQEAVPGIELSVPALSDTEDAAPDWYRQFTFSSAADESPLWKSLPGRSLALAWTKGERWSLNINMTQRNEGTPVPLEEMSAGATFKITPRLSIGGQLSVGASRLEDSALPEEQQVETGIRLQSAFKF